MDSVTIRIVSIVGARPQFIKAAVVSKALRDTNRVEEILVHTGQHYDDNMSEVFFDELEIQAPDYNLGIGSGTHGAQTGQMLASIEKVLLDTKPNWVIVYGDTNSTLAGALSAVKLHISVAHIEAGLRSFNRKMPEEINRVLTDHASDLLFTPTAAAQSNLIKEGIPENKIHLVGDVMFDAALYYGSKAENASNIQENNHLKPNHYILATIHRAENTDDPVRLRAIFSALSTIGKEIPIVLPLHPRTRIALQKEDLFLHISKSVQFIDPVGYLDMMVLEKHASLIITDSGGIQKEAYFHGVPCVTLRNETEWVELVELGWNTLVSPENKQAIVSEIRQALKGENLRPATDDLYGGGKASIRVAEILVSHITL
jgi:UDP-GlcNAc3NAcA epimerase